ncbi:MAG: hypothetical protein AAFX53_03795 [Bacteroidota bacterium]
MIQCIAWLIFEIPVPQIFNVKHKFVLACHHYYPLLRLSTFLFDETYKEVSFLNNTLQVGFPIGEMIGLKCPSF